MIITLPASILHAVNALLPGLTAFGTGLAARLLPAPIELRDNTLHTGWDSRSPAAPSILIKLSDRAIRPNNE
ncbi:MAG TPA: hypothetical protein VGJ93_13045 [Desulfuromonadaceae bacterium]